MISLFIIVGFIFEINNAQYTCDIEDADKKDCAKDKASDTSNLESICSQRNCCYKNMGTNSKIPWCYNRTYIPTTIITTILTTFPTTVITTIPTTVITTIPTTIITTIPTTIITTVPEVECKQECLECNEESNNLGLCISCNKELGYNNVNYTTEEYPKSKYFHCYKETLKNFYYNEAQDQYRPCYKTCETCDSDGDAEIHNCKKCKTVKWISLSRGSSLYDRRQKSMYI